MIASGAGLYVVYTPFNAMLFDRMVAVSGRVANAGFLIYVADAAGYAGSCALLLWRNFGMPHVEWLDGIPAGGVRDDRGWPGSGDAVAAITSTTARAAVAVPALSST